MSLLLFQVNVSIGGDDSYYILRAFQFVHDGTYPAYQGPLYPITISPFIALFGLNVILIKFISVIFTAVFFIFFYKAYRGKISSLVLVLSLFLLAVNYQVLYFSSQTYSEAFYIMIQALFLWYFFRFYERIDGRDGDLRKDYKEFIILGLVMLFMVLAKNIGLTVLMSVFTLFLLEKRWKALAFSFISFSGIYGIYFTVKSFLTDVSLQVASQGSVLLLKDPYDASKGKEDFFGYVNRLIENSNIYLSKNLFKIFHLRGEDALGNIELLTISTYAVIITGLIIWFRRNRFLFFSGLHLLITLVVTFIIVQTRWDTDRLIFIVVPFCCVFLFATLRELISRIKLKFLQPVFFILVVLFIFSNLSFSSSKIDLLRIKKNMKGDKYLGYTEDWQNYLKLSEWSANNLPEGSFVACRKAGMSSIYGEGKEFYNVSRVFSENADTLLDAFESNQVTHVIMANLRRNPKVKTEYTINTIRRYLYYIETTYPGTFMPVYQEGTTGNEEANLFSINYEVRKRMRSAKQSPQ